GTALDQGRESPQRMIAPGGMDTVSPRARDSFHQRRFLRASEQQKAQIVLAAFEPANHFDIALCPPRFIGKNIPRAGVDANPLNARGSRETAQYSLCVGAVCLGQSQFIAL